MGAAELQGRFLKVGYARREQPGGERSPTHNRPVMGRKGIGKLAMFSLANRIDLWSKKEGSPEVAGPVLVARLKEEISRNVAFTLEHVIEQYEWHSNKGPRIVYFDQIRRASGRERGFQYV